MHNSILDEVVAGLKAYRGIWPRIATETEVPYSTLQKIAQRQRKNPRVQTVVALHDWLRRHSANDDRVPQQAAQWLGADRRQMRG